MTGFAFKFSSGQEIDQDWNADVDYLWECFNNAGYIPLVGDDINFWYILTQMEDKHPQFLNLLKDYKTPIFKVVSREYCPLKHNGVWNLYYLTLEPIKVPDLSHYITGVKQWLDANGYAYDSEIEEYYIPEKN